MTFIAGEEVSCWALHFVRMTDFGSRSRIKVKIPSRLFLLIFFIYLKINFYIHPSMELLIGGFLFATLVAYRVSSPFCPLFVSEVTCI